MSYENFRQQIIEKTEIFSLQQLLHFLKKRLNLQQMKSMKKLWQ